MNSHIPDIGGEVKVTGAEVNADFKKKEVAHSGHILGPYMFLLRYGSWVHCLRSGSTIRVPLCGAI